MRVAVLGGFGYIGSHTVLELKERGHEVHVIDWDHNSPNKERVQALADSVSVQPIQQCSEIYRIQPDVVINLAAYISVEDSVKHPLQYWHNNVSAVTETLMYAHNAHYIFASTGTAYNPTNPYARSKRAAEQVVADYQPPGGHTIFRFYNVSGLAPTLKPTGQPTHLIRVAAEAAKGMRGGMAIYGTDWPTHDGTCVRDYVDVRDIAFAIANAVDHGPTNKMVALGTGTGYSVREVVDIMKKTSGVNFTVREEERRVGDDAVTICALADRYEYFKQHYDLEDMCYAAFKNL